MIDTDKKSTYPQILKEVLGDKLVLERYESGDETESKKLFPVNNTMACMRAEKAMLRRESWYIAQDKDWLNRRMALYIFYYNYVRIKKYSVKERRSKSKNR